MRQRDPCNWKCTSSMAQRSIISSRARLCSFFIFLLRHRICIGNLGPRHAQAKSKLSEEALALADSQSNVPLLSDKLREGLSIPKIGAKSPVHWATSKSTADLFQLFGAESLWPASSVPLSQAGKTFFLEAAHPISNSSRGVPKEPCNFAAAQALCHKKKSVQPMIVTSLFRAADFILEGEHHVLTFDDLDSSHSGKSIPLCRSMRNYL